MSISDGLMIMIAFANFVLLLIGLMIEIIKNTKNNRSHF